MRTTKQTQPFYFEHLIYVACMALLGLLIAVLGYQFMLAGLSKALGYETKMVFGKVISAPFENKYWSSNRVMVMYAFPPVLYLLLSFAAALYLYFTRRVDSLYRLLFWCMVFGLIFISAQLTMAPWASVQTKDSGYQGLVVVTNWWGFASQQLFVLSFFSLLINLLFGFLSFRIVMQLSPSSTAQQTRQGQRTVIRQQFIYPVLLTAVPALLLAYPSSLLFFTIVFAHILLWLPGLYIKTRPGYRHKSTLLKSPPLEFSYRLAVVVLVVVVLVRIFM